MTTYFVEVPTTDTVVKTSPAPEHSDVDYYGMFEMAGFGINVRAHLVHYVSTYTPATYR